jgi:RNA 2',3'-cyclic 3'-phosphodiesterase
VTTRFVAIDVAPAVREALDAAIAPVRECRPGYAWTDPLGWHVTLAFLGALPATAVRGVVDVVEQAVAVVETEGGPPRWLMLGGATSFGGRVLVARVEDEPEGRVAALGVCVQSALHAAGYAVQQRPVRPHLTLARARRGRTVDGAVVAATQRALAAGAGEAGEVGVVATDRAWPVTTVGVWSSLPRPHGPARYLIDAEVAVGS